MSIIILGLIGLIILNPSFKKFKEFGGELETKTHKVTYRKVANYILFSIYEKETADVDDDGGIYERYTRTYTGFAGNFWRRW